jgi:hypothetical protein
MSKQNNGGTLVTMDPDVPNLSTGDVSLAR